MALKDLEIKYAARRSRDYKLFDGEGLYVLVRPGGSKLWRFKYAFGGKEKTLSFGKYPAVSAAVARQMRSDAKALLAKGIDPGEEKKAKKSFIEAPTLFEPIARAWHANRVEELDEAHALRVMNRMERDVFPALGKRDIKAITAPEVLEVVRAVEARGALDVSRRIKQGIGQVFRFAIASGWATSDPTVSLNDALKPKVRHMARVPLAELPELVLAIRNYDGEEDTRRRETTRDALLFTLLTWARTSETRFAVWDEFEDLGGEKPLWRLSPARMKMEREHLVPLPAWSAMPIDERRTLLLELADALLQNVEPMARLLTSKQGKPIADAMNEIGGAAMYLKGICTLDLPVTIMEPDDGQGRVVETHHVPIGVVGGIAPWNFPVLLGMFKLAPALLAGNTLVLKPSPFTPLATLKLGELARDILPPGVLNVISGGAALGPWMTSHPGIDKISFTGSTQTGRRVMESAAASLKRVTLELGGNDAAIVLPDVDIDAIAEQLFWSAFRNSGQVCIATKRMYVHSAVYERVRDALVAYARTISVGDGAVAGTKLGPVNNKPQYDRIRDLLADAKACGYRFAVGGEERSGDGYFIPVTIVDNPPEQARIVQEEQFGPVLPLLQFDDIDDAIARANDSPFGLGGSVWCADEDVALSVAKRLNTGNIWLNGLQYLTPLASFGGQKQSGIGVEGGTKGLLEFTVPQTFIRNRCAKV